VIANLRGPLLASSTGLVSRVYGDLRGAMTQPAASRNIFDGAGAAVRDALLSGRQDTDSSGFHEEAVEHMDVLEALYTTRAMRRVKDTPIPEQVQALILDAAVRAPSGGNAQNWRFLLVDDREVNARVAAIYRECITQLWDHFYKDRIEASRAAPEDPDNAQFLRIVRSADYAADHFADYPLLLFGFVQHDPTGGSIFPAIWSAMLAARSEGVGSTLTTALAFRTKEVLRILGVPEDHGWLMAACATFGYPTGRWAVAPRRPVEKVAFRNRWEEPLGWEVGGPL
jgi:nitroreductase